MFSVWRWIVQKVKEQTQNRYNGLENFVQPGQTTAMTRRPRIEVLPPAETTHRLDVPMQATQHIEMKTSAVDRSKGFLIANVPLFGAFALGVWLLSGLVTTTPLFSFLGLCILWSSFVLAWLASYWYTLRVSAEGIAMYEAKSKWGVIQEEQRRRWQHYDRLIEGEE
jgi:hypothetical protein